MRGGEEVNRYIEKGLNQIPGSGGGEAGLIVDVGDNNKNRQREKGVVWEWACGLGTPSPFSKGQPESQ